MNPICDSGMARGKVLLTGASGHLGANLLHRLVQDGEDVRVLLRPGSNNSAVDGLSVDRIYGDLRDPRAVAALRIWVAWVLPSSEPIM